MGSLVGKHTSEKINMYTTFSEADLMEPMNMWSQDWLNRIRTPSLGSGHELRGQAEKEDQPGKYPGDAHSLES